MKSIFNIGQKSSNSFEVNKNIKIINTISIYGIGITIFFAVATLPFREFFYTTVNLLTVGILGLVVYLNKTGKYAISKIVLMLIIPFIVLFFNIAFGPVGNEYYLFAEIIYLFFLFKKTASRIFVFTYLSAIFLFIKIAINYSLFDTRFPLLPWLYYPNVVFAFILSFLGLNLFFKEHIRYQGLVEEQNIKLKEKHAEISFRKDELEKLNIVKDKLFSVVSHDLRGPLRSLVALLDMFGKDYISVEQLKEQLPKISEKLNNTTNLAENLLAWARSQLTGIKPNIEYFNLGEEINNTISLFNENFKAKGLDIKVDIDSHCMLISDREIFKTILRNLIHNAVKFSNRNGQITVKQSSDDRTISIQIADEGQGMDAAFIDQFNKNESMTSRTGTAGETGTGLGLMLVKDFLKLIHGSIFVESEINKGSRFTLAMPKDLNSQL